MSFPTMSHTYGQTRAGIGDIIAVTPGETYALDLVKNGGTAQILWNDKPGTSALDNEWTAMSELDVTDEAGLTVPASAKAIAVNVTVVPAGSPRLPVSLTVTSSASKAMHSRAHAQSGRSGGVGVGFVSDEYNTMVLADGADIFYPVDNVIDPLTNIGPGVEPAMTDEQINNAPPVMVENEPWVGAKCMQSQDTRYRTLASAFTIEKINEFGSIEVWIRPTTVANGRNVFMHGSDNGSIQFGGSTGQLQHHYSSGATALADPGAWVATTAYVLGDRVRLIADTGARMHECTIAGTSGTSEPTFSTVFGTVVDGGTLTWQDCGPRSEFNEVGANRRGGDGDADLIWTGPLVTVNEWHHVVSIRRANGNLAMYLDGVKAYEMDVQASSGNIGTQGLPIPYQVDSAGFTTGSNRWFGDNGSEEDEFGGRFSKLATYRDQELSDAQILAHYNKGVELGLT